MRTFLLGYIRLFDPDVIPMTSVAHKNTTKNVFYRNISLTYSISLQVGAEFQSGQKNLKTDARKTTRFISVRLRPIFRKIFPTLKTRFYGSPWALIAPRFFRQTLLAVLSVRQVPSEIPTREKTPPVTAVHMGSFRSSWLGWLGESALCNSFSH